MTVYKKLVHKLRAKQIPGDITHIWDDYLRWLFFANAGMMSKGNVYSMHYAVANLPSSAPIVEIGSFCGLSTNVLTYFKERLGVANALVTCDRWEFEGAKTGSHLEGTKHITHEEYRKFVKESYVRNVRMFGRHDLPYTVEMTSDEFFAAWSEKNHQQDVFGRDVRLGGPISFCYIDGNHTYEYAWRDYLNTDKYLEEGGWILFDDSADFSEWDVRKVVRDVLRTGRYRTIARNPNYLLRKYR